MAWYSFGATTSGSMLTRTLIVSNSSSGQATLGSVSNQGLGLEAPFSLTGGTCRTGANLPAGQTCTLAIAFSPSHSGRAVAKPALHYTTDATPSETSLQFGISGASGEPAASALVISQAPAYDFGSKAVGTSRAVDLALINLGLSPLKLGALDDAALGLAAPFTVAGGTCTSGGSLQGFAPLSLADAAAADYRVTYNPTLAQICSLHVVFAPVTVGATSRTLRVPYTTVDTATPGAATLTLTGRGTPWVAIAEAAAGDSHTCARFADGRVRCWGFNGFGELGYLNERAIGGQDEPLSAGDVAVGAAVTELTAGSRHTCALLSGGAVRCWGVGSAGQLGYGNTDTIGDDEAPSTAGDVNVGGSALQVAAGGLHTCVLLSNHRVRCWGDGSSGQLGYANTNSESLTPGDVDVGADVMQIAAGENHTCALLSNGKVRCWGLAESGQLGYANTKNIGDDEPPSAAGDVDVGGPVTQISAGGRHTCALLANRQVRCWGANFAGQLGYAHTNDIGDTETPASSGDVQVGGDVQQVVTGYQHTCALLTNGKLRCWGNAQYGQLGYGNTRNVGDDELPSAAGDVDVGGNATQLASSGYHTCAVLSDGNLRCWGDGSSGQLGYGNWLNIGDDERPASAGNVPVQ